MAPERRHGQSSDHRSDVYALVCVLYECLTAEKPVPAPEPLAYMFAHINPSTALLTTDVVR